MRTPDYTSLDLIALAPIRDPATASQSLLSLLKRQHALMSGWGGPPQSRTLFFYAESSLVDRTISYRVPPGVTDIDVEVVASGNGPVNFATAVDAEGVTARFVDAFADDPGPESATTVRANGLRVLASPVWAFTDVEIAVEIAAGSLLQTYTLTIYPRQVPRHRGLTSYYESLDGSDGLSYLEASTNLAARLCLPGTGSIASFTLLAWVAQLDTNGRGIVQIGDPAADAIVGFAEGRDAQSFSARRAGTGIGDGGALPPDDDSYFLMELTSNGSTVALTANGASYAVVSVSGSFAVPADLFRLLSGYGDGARIRNIALMSGALTSDERTALLATGYTHDYRTDYDDGAGHVWMGRTPPFYWCTPAQSRGGEKVGLAVYAVEAGETLSTASGPFTGDVLLTFWFLVDTLAGDGTLVRDGGSDAGIQISALPDDEFEVATYTDYVLDVLDWPGILWHHAVIWSSAGVLYFYVDGLELFDGSFDALTGSVVFGSASAANTVLVTDIAYVQRTHVGAASDDAIASLKAAGRGYGVADATGDWAAVTGSDLLARWTTKPVAGVVASDGATSLPLTFSAPPSGPQTFVVNSGNGGECDLDLYGDTTSETD